VRRSALKGAVALTARAPCPPSQPARAPLPSRPSSRYPSRAAAPSSALSPPVADPAAPCLGEAPVSPETGAQRRPPAAAAEHPTAGHLHPVQAPKQAPRDPRTLSRPFPGQEPRRPHRNCASRAGRPPQGPHCKPQNLSRVFIAKR
jgi:hypothetical protein